MKKKFLLDTNVLIRSPRSLFVFEENDVRICHTTLEELDTLKSRQGEVGYSAREAIRLIYGLRDNGDLSKGVKLPSGGTFKVIPDSQASPTNLIPDGWTTDKPDNRIILTALDKKAVLVTSDVSLLIKAEAAGVKTEVFRNEQVSDKTLKYSGRTTVYADDDVIKTFHKGEPIPIEDLYDFRNINPHMNEFIQINNLCTDKGAGIGYFDGEYIRKLLYADSRPFDVVPKNVGQKFAIEALMAPANQIPLVILRGPAGTAKTFLALAVGLEKTYNQREYRKMLILRPNIKFDEDIGYLKGDEMDKIRPLIRPCLDNIEALLTHPSDSGTESEMKVNELFERGIVTAEALAYLRGRSIAHNYIFVDEAQNATPNQILGIISRAGMGSKIVVAGDPDQIDNPKLDRRNNGLVYAAEKMLGSKLCMQLAFENSECVRSPLAMEAARLL